MCLITATPLTEVQAHLRACGMRVEEGPIARTGAIGPTTSVYVRDPDGNLIEIATYKPVQFGDPEPYPPVAGTHTEEEEQR